MIKLLCSDFDNTLAVHGKVADRNVEKIKELQENGVEFAMVTGRVASNISGKAKEYGIKAHLIGTNGSIVYQNGTDLTYENPIELNVLLDIIDECYEKKWWFWLFDRDVVYIPKEKFRIVTMTPLKHLVSKFVRTTIVPTDRTLQAFIENGAKAHKINIYPGDQIDSARAAYLANELLYVTWSNEKKLEVMSAGVNKWTGIQHLAENLGIKENEIATIGDYNNDVPMIQAAELGFAIGNAHEEIKAIADQIVGNAKDGGVGDAVDFILDYNERLGKGESMQLTDERIVE